MKHRPTNIYIDGENLFYQLVSVLVDAKLIKSRADLIKIDLNHLLSHSTKLVEKPKSTRYYGTKLHLVKDMGDKAYQTSLKMIQQKRAWGSWLSKQNIEFITAGNLKARQKGKNVIFQEKGVDVRIAVDMVQSAYEKKGLHYVVVSSDSDIIPALRVVAQKGHIITYVGFSEALNMAIVAHSQQTLTFTREDIIEAFNKVNKA